MIYVLRLVHIVGGVFWVGSVMFATLILAPSLKALGPGAGPVMNQLMKVRKMPIVMMVSGLFTVAAGLWLLMIDMRGAQPGMFMQSGMGRTLSLGGGVGILALIFGMSVNLPASKKLAALGAAIAARGGPPNAEEAAEMQRLTGRLSVAGQVVMVMLIITTIAMALARYVP
jgi:hypothetical protein